MGAKLKSQCSFSLNLQVMLRTSTGVRNMYFATIDICSDLSQTGIFTHQVIRLTHYSRSMDKILKEASE